MAKIVIDVNTIKKEITNLIKNETLSEEDGADFFDLANRLENIRSLLEYDSPAEKELRKLHEFFDGLSNFVNQNLSDEPDV